MSRTILITGGTGYVGGRIVQHLALNERYNLRIGTTHPERAGLGTFGNSTTVPLELSNPEQVNAACSDVETIIHLAALNEIDSAADPEKALLVNGIGTVKLLEAARKAGVRRFIYFSTAHVYGSPLQGRIDEAVMSRPIHPYAITHRVAEDFVLAAHDNKILTGIVVRLSNGFGAPADANVNRWSLIVNDLCRQAVTAGKLELKSSGIQWRDFITLTDVSRAVQHLLELPADKVMDGLFNLGGESSLQIIQLTMRIAARCKEVLGFTPQIIRPEPRAGDVFPELDYRIDKIKSTGFSLLGNIDDEIDATLLICRDAFGGGKA
jgi:UDP-glucose 4-epimerase